MTDRNDRHERAPERRPAEGVRIIGAEEAQKALDAGQAAGRRADDELRFGDVPPAPSGPRPPHRFPLPDSVDPAEAVPRPPVAPIRPDPAAVARLHRVGHEPVAPPEAPAPADPDAVAEAATPDTGASRAGQAGTREAGTEASATEASVTEASASRSSVTEPQVNAGTAPRPGHVGDVDVDRDDAHDDADRSGYDDGSYAEGDDAGYVPLPRSAEAVDADEPTGALPVTEVAAAPTAYHEVGDADTARSDPGQHGGGLRWAARGDVETAGRPAGEASDDPGVARPWEPSGLDPVEELARGAAGWVPAGGWDRPSGPYGDDAPAGSAAASDGEPDDPDAEVYDPDVHDGAAYDGAAYDGAAYDGAAYDPAAYADDARADEMHPDDAVTGTDPTVVVRASAPVAPTSSSWNLGERSDWSAPDAYGAGAEPARYGDEPTDYRAPTLDVSGYEPPAADDVPDLAPPEEGITVTGSTVLPHWTEPAEGVPSSLLDPELDAAGLDAWNAVGSGGVRWRGEGEDWDEADDAAGFLGGDADEVRVGALDTDRSDRSDLYSFDEAFQQLEEERSGAHPVVALEDEEAPVIDDPVAAADDTRSTGRRRGGTATAARARAGAARARGGSARPAARRSPAGAPARGALGARDDLGSRVTVGAGLVVVLVIAYAVGPKALLVFAAAIVLFCAAEAYGILQRCGFRPATLLGLAATAGLMFAAYWRGSGAVPLVLALTFAATMLWYLLGIVDARPLANVAVTSMTVLWIGVLGSFSALLLRSGGGRGLFLGTVVVTVVADVVAYFVGRRFGHRPLAPHISPGKTVEGLVGAAVAAIVVGIIVGKAISPWGGIKHGLLLGIVVAVVAPIGDLFESLIKRDLSVKDSGTALAGHGGLLDRFDSLLLVLPAAYYLCSVLNIIK